MTRLMRLVWLVLAAWWLAGCHAVNPFYDPARPHHRPEGFINSDGQSVGPPLSDLLTWVWQRTRDGLPPKPSRFVDGYSGFPVRKPDLAMLKANRSQVTATWVGHATMLLQIDGVNILTDPQFSQRAFMVQWAGPQRRVPLPMTLAELPHIDLVVISHNHYDHLDLDTVLGLNRQPGGPPLFAVPLGIDLWMKAQGIDRVKALDWWQSIRVGGVDVTMVPVHHWSARSLTDRNTTLWGGWVLKSPQFSAFFAGDTGYSSDFADIGQRFGGFDLALIPVGAYEPRWFMSSQHVDPPQAVKMHQDLRARQSIGIHWGYLRIDRRTPGPADRRPGAGAGRRRRAGP